MEIGNRLKFFRIQKDMTQEELANKIISVSYLSKIENNQTSASIEVLELLCEKLGIKLIEEEEYTLLKDLNDWYFSIIQKKKEEAIAFHEHFTKNVQFINDSRAAILFVLFELRFLLFIREYDKAGEQIKKISLFKDIFDSKMNYFYEKFVGQYYNLRNKFAIALEHFKLSEQILSNSIHFENWEKADLYYHIGVNHNRIGKIALSTVYTQQALSIYQSMYDLKRSAECHILLGISYEKNDDFQLAVDNYQLAKKVAENMNDSYLLGLLHHNIGCLYSKQQKTLEAIDEYKESLRYKVETNIIGRIRSIHSLLAEYYNIGDVSSSRKWLNTGQEILAKHQNLEEFKIHFTFYEYWLNNDEALEKFVEKEAIPFFEQEGDMKQVISYSEILAKRYQEKNKYKLASYYYSIVVKYLKMIRR
ncbi:helix-turn-helix transcriptional regulator [Fredinandcohnia quinoae]|uniref:Helix-turn-helix transcriptional regulator n=1 Tax=Fredinandcohnia quinoae TaxID=2918902 RepID=A0AAW5E989_9BACI|nr:helix-turn-helix transcriptional regulator [Fredinandcohnia sp. SECRCQ15]MCH1627544.1 helix-turn-helix transcriptional regulator [Fredinandcohnia sp. SECRCQ15]